MSDVDERTTLEYLESAVTEEFYKEGTIKDATLLVAGALVEIAKTLQFFREEIVRDRKRWADEEKEAVKEDREREPQK